MRTVGKPSHNNSVVKMFHKNSDEESKVGILELFKWTSLTCIIGTVAFSTGMDIADVHAFIH